MAALPATIRLLIAACVVASIPYTLAQDHADGMDMSMDGPMSMAEGHMTPYLHFQPGDTLWFLGWVPESKGVMVGACIGLFLFSLVERWLAAVRAGAEVFWRRRYVLLNRVGWRN